MDDMQKLLHELDVSIVEIDAVVQELKKSFPPPRFVELPGRTPAFRYEKCDDVVMSYLKCVRCVSLLYASQTLLRGGFYQEIGILSRCMAEAGEDVMFLSTPLGDDGAVSEHQKRLVEEFFLEEFEDPTKTLTTQNKRHRVPRDVVLAGIARIKGTGLNPSDAKAVSRVPHFGLSGYVHGAYPHIMELFDCPAKDGKADEASGRYRTSGRMPAQRMEEMVWQLCSEAERVAIATEVVTKRVGRLQLTARLEAVIERLATVTGSVRPADLEKEMKALKAKQSGKPQVGCPLPADTFGADGLNRS